MKVSRKLIIIVMCALTFGCIEKVDPAVDTLYIKGGDQETHIKQAIPKLFQHYVSSKRDKEFYEVISKKEGRYILNYAPNLKLLTMCADPGSGWSRQFKNFELSTLEMLANDGYSFDDLGDRERLDSKFDSLLVINTPSSPVKTNGSPSL